jgi:hypothetical protein
VAPPNASVKGPAPKLSVEAVHQAVGLPPPRRLLATIHLTSCHQPPRPRQRAPAAHHEPRAAGLEQWGHRDSRRRLHRSLQAPSPSYQTGSAMALVRGEQLSGSACQVPTGMPPKRFPMALSNLLLPSEGSLVPDPAAGRSADHRMTKRGTASDSRNNASQVRDQESLGTPSRESRRTQCMATTQPFTDD